ncbi:hypothetical protein GS896_25490 [Rhodococcus hoagii]|nr:hypothetical protein [Prescottella equi]NKT55976.1 hypothetical protein [Prescottella equi]NKU37399.1 hypothetical protein [Prescottella equi]
MPDPVTPTRGRESEWLLSDVLDHILTRRPAAAAAVPRLHPRSRTPAQAEFIGAEVVGDTPVHLWLPGDGGGAVAIVYTPTAPHVWPGAEELLDRLGDSYTMLAAVGPHLSDVLTALPEVVVYERAAIGYEPELNTRRHGCLTAYEARWQDLACLLRRAVPWWPATLLANQRVVSWFPGTDPVRALPHDPRTGASPGDLLGLASAAAGVTVDIINRMARTAAAAYGCSARVDIAAVNGRHGIVVAATPDLPGEPVKAPSSSEIDLLLASEASEAAVERAGYLLADLGLLLPVWTATRGLRLTALGPLGKRWIDRLEPVPDSRRRCVGWRQLLRLAPPGCETSALRPVYDPAMPSLWIGLSDRNVVYSVGSETPSAAPLSQLDLTAASGECVFWEDKAGQVWPLPEQHGRACNVGYRGSGPRQLAHTAAILAHDGSAALGDVSYDRETDPTQALALLSTSPWPSVVDVSVDDVGIQVSAQPHAALITS